MKAVNLKNIDTEQAPIEWREINEIKSQYPNQKNVEVSLQKLRKKNICIWMINKNNNWEYASDFFFVRIKNKKNMEKLTEEEILNKIANDKSYNNWNELMLDTKGDYQIQCTVEAMRYQATELNDKILELEATIKDQTILLQNASHYLELENKELSDSINEYLKIK